MSYCSSFKLNDDVIFSPTFTSSNPTQNYALAAASLLQTVTTNANTINHWAILDSGATSHFLTTTAPASNVQQTMTPIIVCLPNDEHVHSTHTCTLNIPALPRDARAAHIIPGLASHSLLSMVTLCNAGCDVHFTKIGCIVKYCGRTIVCGRKCTRMGLWMLPLTSGTRSVEPLVLQGTCPPLPLALSHAVAANIDATLSVAEYAQYIHQLLCSPQQPPYSMP